MFVMTVRIQDYCMLSMDKYLLFEKKLNNKIVETFTV